MGRTSLSNKSTECLTDTFVNRYKYLFNLKIAFKDCPARVNWASEKEPPVVKKIPKYINLFIIILC